MPTLPSANPPFSVVLKNADASVALRSERTHLKDFEAPPLTQTVYYTYHEKNLSVTYPFEVVVARADTPDRQTPRACFKISKLLDTLIHTWTRQWRKVQVK